MADGSTATSASGDEVASADTRWSQGRALWLAVGCGLVAMWGIVTFVSADNARDDLELARVALQDVQSAFSEGEVSRAVERADAASGHAQAATRRLSRPWHALARVSPGIGRDMRAAHTIAGAVEDLTAAASRVAQGLESASDANDLSAAVSSLPDLRDAVMQLRAATGEATQQVLATAPRFAVVRDARTELLGNLDELDDIARRAADSLEVAAWLSGQGQPRTVLIGAITPAELRGSGGFLGALALTTIEDGSVNVGEFQTVSGLVPPPPEAVAPPSSSWEARYGPFGGTSEWRNYTMSPDVPAASQVIADAWEVTQGGAIDGVVLVTPFALEQVVASQGAIDVPGQGVISAEEVADYLLVDAYADFDNSTDRQSTLGAVAAGALDGFLETALRDPSSSADVMRTIVRRGDVRLWARDADTQAAIRALGADGALGLHHAAAHVVLSANNATATKVDTFMRTNAVLKMRLTTGGRALTDLTVNVENAAPRVGEPYVIGPANPGFEAGEIYHLWSIFCGQCTPQSGATTTDSPVTVTRESGQAGMDTWLRLQPGQRASMRFGWEQGDAWTSVDGNVHARLRWRPLPGAEPTRLDATIDPGEDFTLVDSSIPVGIGPSGEIRFEFFEAGDHVLEFEFAHHVDDSN